MILLIICAFFGAIIGACIKLVLSNVLLGVIIGAVIALMLQGGDIDFDDFDGFDFDM